MARAVISDPKRRAAYEPLYDIDPQTGANVEVFYADRVLAESFSARGPGWFSWSCLRGCLPDGPPKGPFTTSYSISGLASVESRSPSASRGGLIFAACLPDAYPVTDALGAIQLSY